MPLPEGLEFLYVDNPNSSLLVLQAFKTELEKTPRFQHLDLTGPALMNIRRKTREELRRVITSTRAGKHIISAEDISTFSEDELREMRDFFAPQFDEIQVFIYVRPIKERIESGFQEVLKTRFRSINHCIPMNYMRLAQKFDAVFGPANTHFFRYSRSDFPNGSIIDHFLRQLGIPHIAVDAAISNTRLSRQAVQLLYAYRMRYPHQQRGDQALIRKLESLTTADSTRFHFHSCLYNEVLLTDESAARCFAKRSGFSVDENISAHDSIGIRGEDDLLDISKQTIEWLHSNLSMAAKLVFRKSHSPRKIARALNSMRKLLPGD